MHLSAPAILEPACQFFFADIRHAPGQCDSRHDLIGLPQVTSPHSGRFNSRPGISRNGSAVILSAIEYRSVPG